MKLVNGTYQPCQGQRVHLDTQDGTLESRIVHTDEKGEATTSFTINKDKSTASVYAHCVFDDEQGIRHDYVEKVEFYVTPYKLKCLTPEVEMKKSDGTATIRYELLEYKEGEWVACPDKKLVFTATNGSAQPDYALTNENGICQTVFTPTEGATEGTVTGTCTIVVNEKANFVWTQSQAAHITITDGGGGGGGESPCGDEISDKDLKKANELGLNTYMIDGKVTKLDGPDDMIEWSVTEDIEGNRFNAVNWFKEDPVYYTTAWGTIYGFPDDMYGEEIYVSEGSGMSISFGAFIDPAGGYTETNVIDFTTENIQKAVYRLCKDANGNIFAIAYVRSKDGKEGMFKVKAKPAPANSRSRVR